MAVERLFFEIKQAELIRASQKMHQGAELLLDRKLDEAEESFGQARSLIERARGIDEVAQTVLERMESLGVRQPQAEFLERLALTGGGVSEGAQTQFPPRAEQSVSALETAPKPILVEQPTVEPPPPEVVRPEKVEIHTERIKGVDLTDMEMRVAKEFLIIKQEQGQVRFKKLTEIAENIYKEELAKMDEQERKKKISSRSGAVSITRDVVIKKLTTHSEKAKGTIPITHQEFLEYARSLDYYPENISFEHLASVLRRTVEPEIVVRTGQINPEVLANPTKTPSSPRKESTPLPVALSGVSKPEQPRVENDISEEEELITVNLLAIRDDGQDYRYKTLRAAGEAIYDDSLRGLDDQKRVQELLNIEARTGVTIRTIVTKIEFGRLQLKKNQPVPTCLKALIDWIDAEVVQGVEIYKDLTTSALKNILSRSTDFQVLLDSIRGKSSEYLATKNLGGGLRARNNRLIKSKIR